MSYTDTELLDFLEEKTDGNLWVARDSTTGRGYRVHNISSQEAYIHGIVDEAAPTVREAISIAMRAAYQ